MAVPLAEFHDRSQAKVRAQDAVQEGRRGTSVQDVAGWRKLIGER
jgi:hypothetical protein